jgi:hypothetical protein
MNTSPATRLPVSFPAESVLLTEQQFRARCGGIGKTVSAKLKAVLGLEKFGGRVSAAELELKLQRRAEWRASHPLAKRKK